jgi:iron complex outermembrane receptor protein
MIVSYGLEAELNFKPIEHLTLSAGLSLLHSEIKNRTRLLRSAY